MGAAGLIKTLIWAEIHMREVLQGCVVLNNFSPMTMEARDCILTGIIVSYCRSFGQNDGMPPLPSDFRILPSRVLQNTHDVLMELRDKRYAHSSHTYAPKSYPISAYNDDLRAVKILISTDGRLTAHARREGFPDDEISRIVDLANFQRERIIHEALKLEQHLVDKFRLGAGEYLLGKDFPPPDA